MQCVFLSPPLRSILSHSVQLFSYRVYSAVEKRGILFTQRGKSMASISGIRSGVKLLMSSESAFSKSVTRGLHATAVKRMGGGHGNDYEYYLHTKHMYNLDRMKHQALKVSLGVLTAFSIGVGVPIYAVIFQQKKTASG